MANINFDKSQTGQFFARFQLSWDIPISNFVTLKMYVKVMMYNIRSAPFNGKCLTSYLMAIATFINIIIIIVNWTIFKVPYAWLWPKSRAPDRNQDEIGKLNDSPNSVFSLFWTTQDFQPPLQCPEVGSIGSGRQQRRNAHQALLSWLVEERQHANALIIAGTVLMRLRCSYRKYRQGHVHAMPCRPADNVKTILSGTRSQCSRSRRVSVISSQCEWP